MRNLHREFVALAFDIVKMKNRLMALLLEIYEKEIYRDHGCRTIYEYGFRYARLSKEVIDKALRTLKHLKDKPCLRKAVETQGIHKVAMVATIATPENEKVLAGHVENMSKAALFEFSKELRHGHEKCEAVRSVMKVEFDDELQVLFLRLKQCYAKDCSNAEALKVMLKKLESMKNPVPGNGNFKKSSSVKTTDGSRNTAQQSDATPRVPKIPSRHIPITTKRKILNKYDHKCAYPNCANPVQQLHHRIPYAFRGSHETVMPLCKVHHEFAHSGLIKHELKEPEEWRLNITGGKSLYDNLRLGYRSG